VLIVQGHQDPLGDKTAEDIHAAIATSVLTYLDKCGHYPWLEQPVAFRKAIAQFLR
jgi:proline iminopeptidase